MLTKTLRCVVAIGLCAGAAGADVVQVRDRLGGESELGFAEGLYETGTGGTIRASLLSRPASILPTGAFDFEMREDAAFEAHGMYSMHPGHRLAFGPNLPDTVGASYVEVAVGSYLFGPDDVKTLEVLWGSRYDESRTSATHAAAFQSIIWELAIDSRFDLSDGFFALDVTDVDTDRAATLAQMWYDDIVNEHLTKSVSLTLLLSETSGLIMAVPAPSGVALMLLGIAGTTRRRRNG